MPEASLVIKAEDRYSDAVRKMSQTTKSLNKDVDDLEEQLRQLSMQKAPLKAALDEANRALKEAQKQFAATGDEADGLKLQLQQANYDNIKRNFDLVTRAARDAERQLSKAGSAGRGAGEGVRSGVNAMVSAIATSGIGDMVGNLALSLGTSFAGSTLGDAGGSIVGSALQSAASGAAVGTMIAPGVGTAVGAAAGGLIGLATGGLQAEENRDDAFQSYVQEAVEGQLEEMDSIRSSGSTTAGQREQDQIAFAQRFGSDEAAQDYLDQVKAMAVGTNYTYDEITGYSKSLLNSYTADETLDVLQKLSDATAGLNLDSSGVSMFIAGLSRMRTTDKATQEYLNYFSERGLDVYEALSRSTGADKSRIAEMVSDGDIGGTQAAQAVLDYIQEEFGGLSEKLSTTYDAMVDNLGDIETNLNARMGEGYNSKSIEGMQADIDAYGGELGEALGVANQIIGEGKALAENLDRKYSREAMSALLLGSETTVYGEDQASRLEEMHNQYTSLVDQYQTATEEDKAVIAGQIEALKEEAQAMADSAYDASEMSQQLHDINLDLIAAIRENTLALGSAAWSKDYETNQEYSKGRAAGMASDQETESGVDTESGGSVMEQSVVGTIASLLGFGGKESAPGLQRVPYNNFPAVLHEGERVLTAREARNYERMGGFGGITINMPGTVIREDADIERIGQAVLDRVIQARVAGVYQ